MTTDERPERPERGYDGLAVAEPGMNIQPERFLDAMRHRTRPGLKGPQRCVQISLAHLVGPEHSPHHIYQEYISEKLEGEALEAESYQCGDRW